GARAYVPARPVGTAAVSDIGWPWALDLGPWDWWAQGRHPEGPRAPRRKAQGLRPLRRSAASCDEDYAEAEAGERAHDVHAEAAGPDRAFGNARPFHDPELFADLPPLEAFGALDLFAPHQELAVAIPK